MGTPAAPRLDARLVQYIAGARLGTPAAEVTRAVGDLAWRLGRPRPSYEQVRLLLRRRVQLVRSRVTPVRRCGLPRLRHVLRRVAGLLLAFASGIQAVARRLRAWAARLRGFL
jgi:hypothetical protein